MHVHLIISDRLPTRAQGFMSSILNAIRVTRCALDDAVFKTGSRICTIIGGTVAHRRQFCTKGSLPNARGVGDDGVHLCLLLPTLDEAVIDIQGLHRVVPRDVPSPSHQPNKSQSQPLTH